MDLNFVDNILHILDAVQSQLRGLCGPKQAISSGFNFTNKLCMANMLFGVLFVTCTLNNIICSTKLLSFD